MNKKVFVIGHREPDTDSICSALALAELKNRQLSEHGGDIPMSPSYGLPVEGEVCYEAVRAGALNAETRFVLDTFGVQAPALLKDARVQISDIDYSVVDPVRSDMSLRRAWMRMRDVKKSTLAVAGEDGGMEGLITTSDIAKSYMAVFDTQILGIAHTPFENILDTLDAELVVGDPASVIDGGKVSIAAANTDIMGQVIDAGDVVILGNRYEAQLCAIECGAAMIIVCDGAAVSRTIRKVAATRNCAVVSTPYDTYAAARLINQSLPVAHFMTRSPLRFNEKSFLDDITEIMTTERFRDFPVIDDEGRYLGMISRRNLIDHDRKQVILVDHNARSQSVTGIAEADILEIVDHHRLSTIETIRPVVMRNQPVGSTAAIVYQIFLENGLEIGPVTAGLLCSAILSATKFFSTAECTPMDEAAALALAKIAGIEPESFAAAMFEAGSRVEEEGR